MSKTLSPEELMPHYTELLEKGAILPLTISGTSMAPFLVPERDSVQLKAPDRALRRGDIAFYRRPCGRYILHRVYKAEGDKLWFVGDAQDEVEGPLPADCVLALAISAKRKGKQIEKGSFWWDFFAGAWLGFVGRRRKIISLYGKIR